MYSNGKIDMSKWKFDTNGDNLGGYYFGRDIFRRNYFVGGR